MKYSITVYFHYKQGLTTARIYGSIIPRPGERYTLVAHNDRKYSGVVKSIENCVEETDDLEYRGRKGMGCEETVKIIVDADTKTFVR